GIAFAARMRKYQDGAVASLLPVKHGGAASCGDSLPSCGSPHAQSSARFDGCRSIGLVIVAFVAIVTIADAHVATRHHGGNGVLVHHLADLVAQEHHELVE